MTDTRPLTPSELRKVAAQSQMIKTRQEADQGKKHEAEEKALHDAFMAREIRPQAMEIVNAAVRRAAEQGLHEVRMLTFPATYCSDHGRRINNGEPDWPESLEGYAKKAMEFFQKELKPVGYKARAEVLTFPGGVPGDVGLFLTWS